MDFVILGLSPQDLHHFFGHLFKLSASVLISQLFDNLLLVDIYNRAKKLHIDTEAKRVIFIIETSNASSGAAGESV